jgi:hypothetical protein
VKTKDVTIVYAIVDEAAYRRDGHRMLYEQHGLLSHTVSLGDMVAANHALETALQQIASGFGEPAKIAQAALEADTARIVEALK